MATKLNQIIAVANGQKTSVKEKLTAVYQLFSKQDLFTGLIRTYHPKDEDGEKRPSETKPLKYKADELIDGVIEPLRSLYDTVATLDKSNCAAFADVVVDDVVVLKQVPVTTLLFLEKQLIDLHSFANSIPTLDNSVEWRFDDINNVYVSQPSEVLSNKKVPRAFVKYEATVNHPAQVEMVNEDIVVGTWRAVSQSGAIPASNKASMLERIQKLRTAIVVAREEANSIEAVRCKIGDPILEFVFGEYLK